MPSTDDPSLVLLAVAKPHKCAFSLTGRESCVHTCASCYCNICWQHVGVAAKMPHQAAFVSAGALVSVSHLLPVHHKLTSIKRDHVLAKGACHGLFSAGADVLCCRCPLHNDL